MPPGATSRIADILLRALQLVTDFLETLRDKEMGTGRVAMSASADAPDRLERAR